MHRATLRRALGKTRASTRFVKWSRCFLHSGVIGRSCMSIRDCTFSIAPSLTWRAQWRNVRRQRQRKPRRRRSALRSGSKRDPFSCHVTRPAASFRADQNSGETSPAGCNDGGRRRDSSGLSDALGLYEVRVARECQVASACQIASECRVATRYPYRRSGLTAPVPTRSSRDVPSSSPA